MAVDARGIWRDPERFKQTYWSRFAEQGWYFAGDSARYDADGNIAGPHRRDERVGTTDLDRRGPLEAALAVDDHRLGSLPVAQAKVAQQKWWLPVGAPRDPPSGSCDRVVMAFADNHLWVCRPSTRGVCLWAVQPWLLTRQSAVRRRRGLQSLAVWTGSA